MPGEQRAPVVTIDGREQVGGPLDEVDQRAHRDRDAARGEVAAQPVERRQHRELLVDEPRQPGARDLGALVRRRQRPRRRALAAVTTAAGRTLHDAAPLVLLHDVQLLLGQHLGDVEGAAAAVCARVGTQRVSFDLEMRGQRLAPRRATRLGCGLDLGRNRGRRGAVGEGQRSRGIEDRRWRRRRRRCCRSLAALGDREQLGHALVQALDLGGQRRVGRHQLPDLHGQLAELRALLGVLASQLSDGGHAVTRSHPARAVDPRRRRRAWAAIPAAPRRGEIDAGEQRRERRAIDLNLRRLAGDRRQLKAAVLEALRQQAPPRSVVSAV